MAARLLPLLALALFACSERTEGPNGLAPRPGSSVIVVTADALRADELGVYGYGRGTSPSIDRFAKQAVVFERAYSAAATTLQSFVAMFTGSLTTQLQWDQGRLLASTLPETFQTESYETAAFLDNPWLHAKALHRGFDVYSVYDGEADEQVLEAALHWIEGRKNGRFFVWIHFLDPHAPYERLAASAALYDTGPVASYPPRALAPGAPLQIEDATRLRRVRDLYDGEVLHVDRLFARLISRLKALGLLESTFVTLSSDHGESFMEHGRLQHGQLYEEGIHVPLIIRPPGGKGGTRIHELFTTRDLLPLLIHLVGLETPDLPRGFDPSQPRSFVTASSIAPYQGKLEAKATIRGQDFRLIVHCVKGRRELYDLAEDPSEESDVAPSRPVVARKLEGRLWPKLGRESCKALTGQDRRPRIELNPERKKALKALGYLAD